MKRWAASSQIDAAPPTPTNRILRAAHSASTARSSLVPSSMRWVPCRLAASSEARLPLVVMSESRSSISTGYIGEGITLARSFGERQLEVRIALVAERPADPADRRFADAPAAARAR